MVSAERSLVQKTIHTERGRRLAAMLREARVAKGLTLRELGERLGTPHTVVAKIEAGERRVDLVELESICDALGISLVEFVRRYRAHEVREVHDVHARAAARPVDP